MNAQTPAQIKAIQTWTEQRDELLRQIGVHTVERDEVKRQTTEGGLALADIHQQISEGRGRIAELSALEERHKTSVSIEVAELEARKSRLESECSAKEVESKTWDARKAEKVSSIETLSLAHDKMSDQAKIVDQVVGQVIEKSAKHISDMHEKVTHIKTVADSVIEKGNENVKTTNIVLEKLPRYIFELQKPIPIRRTYAAPAGTVIAPEKPQ